MDKDINQKSFITLCYVLVLLSLSIFLHLNQSLFVFQRKFTFKFKTNEAIDIYTKIQSHDGKDIDLYFFDKKSSKDLIFLHGSIISGKVYKRILEMLAAKTDCNIFGFYMRGINNNRGEPSEKGICTEANIIGDFIKSRGNKIIIYGQSLGSSVALTLGLHLGVENIILENPFSSFRTIINCKPILKWFIYLVVDEWDNTERIKKHKGRILFFVSEFDNLVPNIEAQNLADFHGCTKITKLEGSTHYDVQKNVKFIEYLNHFIECV